MYSKWGLGLALALALGAARDVQAGDDAAKSPKDGSASFSAAVKTKPRPKTPTKQGKVQTRAAGVPKGPDESVRRAVAATPIDADPNKGAESPELLAIREADRELFPPPGPPVGIPWPNDLPVPIALDPSQPVVRASGLPPSPSLSEPAAVDAGRDLGWLRALTMPDGPVRWDARVIRYLEYYRDDPRGKNLTQSWIRRSGRYGGAIRRALRERGLPEGLPWGSLRGRGVDPSIPSPARAGGPFAPLPQG